MNPAAQPYQLPSHELVYAPAVLSKGANTLWSNWTLQLPSGRIWVGSGTQGQSGQAIKLFQITPCVNDFQTFDNPAVLFKLTVTVTEMAK